MEVDQPEEYERLTAHEHVLRRPDTYVGSTKTRPIERVVLLPDGQVKIVKANVSPALEKVFDEVMTNALDHKIRDSKMTEIKCNIDSNGTIFISNNGSMTVPTTDFPGTYPPIPTPQVLFHELFTGSNLNDEKKKVVGGRNGKHIALAPTHTSQPCLHHTHTPHTPLPSPHRHWGNCFQLLFHRIRGSNWKCGDSRTLHATLQKQW